MQTFESYISRCTLELYIARCTYELYISRCTFEFYISMQNLEFYVSQAYGVVIDPATGTITFKCSGSPCMTLNKVSIATRFEALVKCRVNGVESNIIVVIDPLIEKPGVFAAYSSNNVDADVNVLIMISLLKPQSTLV